MDLCNNIILLKFIRIILSIINVIKIVIPIILIIKLGIDIYHAVITGENNKIKELSIKRIVAAIAVFLVPTLASLVLKLVEIGGGSKVEYPYCLTSIENIKYYEKLAEKKKKVVENTQKIEQDNSAYEKALYEQAKAMMEYAKQTYVDDTSAMYMGRHYNIPESELDGLCVIAKTEQGSIDGARAEASLMANLYELLRPTNKYYGNGLYNYVRNSGWWSNSANKMDRGGCPANYMNAVRDVLNNGNRTLPFYVNEHDCSNCSKAHACGSVDKGDICKIETDGVTYSTMSEIQDRSNYRKDITKVYTYYQKGGYWIFYSFPAPRSDPFGYTESARKRVEGMNK